MFVGDNRKPGDNNQSKKHNKSIYSGGIYRLNNNLKIFQTGLILKCQLLDLITNDVQYMAIITLN